MKNLKKVLCLVLSLLLLLSVLTACGGSAGDKADTAPVADGDTAPAADGDTSAPAGEGDAAVPEDGVSLSMVMAAGLDNVDPAFNYSMDSMQIISLTDQGLMTFDEEGKVTCGLAESYDISPDGKTYLAIFTDIDEFKRGNVEMTPVTNSWDLLIALLNDSLNGFVINVFGEAVIFTRDFLDLYFGKK